MKHEEKPVTRTRLRAARRLTRRWRKAVAWKIRHRCPFPTRERFPSFRAAKATLERLKKPDRYTGRRRHQWCTVRAVRP